MSYYYKSKKLELQKASRQNNYDDSITKVYTFNSQEQLKQNPISCFTLKYLHNLSVSDFNNKNDLSKNKNILNANNASFNLNRKYQDKQKQSNQKQNINRLRSHGSSQIDRYMKQYQYNCYRINSDIKNNQNQQQAPQIKQIKEESKCHKKEIVEEKRLESISVQDKSGKIGARKQERIHKKRLNLLDEQFSLIRNYHYQQIKNEINRQDSILKKQNKQFITHLGSINKQNSKVVPIKEKQYIIPENSLLKLGAKQDLTLSNFVAIEIPINRAISPFKIEFSHDQKLLIKKITSENQVLRSQAEEKQKYIKELEDKLQLHLQNSMKIQIQMEQKIKTLKQTIQLKQKQIDEKNEILKASDEKIKKIEKIFIKSPQMPCLFENESSISENANIFDKLPLLQKMVSQISQNIAQNDIYKKLINKIVQMKQKIQTTEQQTQLVQKNENHKQYSCFKNSMKLTNLWKWLKKIGKEYEIMKCKLKQVQYEQL